VADALRVHAADQVVLRVGEDRDQAAVDQEVAADHQEAVALDHRAAHDRHGGAEDEHRGEEIPPELDQRIPVPGEEARLAGGDLGGGDLGQDQQQHDADHRGRQGPRTADAGHARRRHRRGAQDLEDEDDHRFSLAL
jgi:hypothetical protein